MFKHACLAINSRELSLAIFPARGNSDTILLQKSLLTAIYNEDRLKGNFKPVLKKFKSVCFFSAPVAYMNRLVPAVKFAFILVPKAF